MTVRHTNTGRDVDILSQYICHVAISQKDDFMLHEIMIEIWSQVMVLVFHDKLSAMTI